MGKAHRILFVGACGEAEALKAIIRNDGYDAAYADSEAAAFKLLNTTRPSLIIIDAVCSNIDGFSIMEKILGEADFGRIPIIFTAACGDVAAIDRGFEMGGADYVMTPFNANELRARIGRSIALKTAADTLELINHEIRRANLEPCHKESGDLEFAAETLVNDLHRTIQTDFMTRLGNRRYIIERIESQVKNAQEFGTTFAVLLADLDHFKFVNDQYGHDCGDEVLKHVARVFQEAAGDQDYVSRWGGEEFMFVIPDTTSEEAFYHGERIRKKLEDTPADYNGQKVEIKVTIGASLFINGEDTAQDVIKRADRALYSGKNNGRNQVVLL